MPLYGPQRPIIPVLMTARCEAFIRPTEDPIKVRTAMANVADFAYSITPLQGQFGEEIGFVSGKARSKTEAQRLTPRLKGFPHLVNEDGEAIFLLDKQAAFAGDIKPGKGIKLAFKFSSFPSNIESIKKEIGESF